jgi:uncharacterized membrane protein YbhN (UPF0104 family)
MKWKRWIEWTIKILILIGSIFFLIWKFKYSSDSKIVFENLPLFWRENYYLFLFLIFLIPVNWGVEALKWRYLLKNLERVSFFKAFKSVMSGVSVGLFTPNRIGEFGGRILYLKNENRSRGVLLSLVGSYSQFFTTLLIGLPATVLYLLFYSGANNEFVGNTSYIVISIILSLSLMLLYFNIKWIVEFLLKLPFLKKHEELFIIIQEIPRKQLFNILLMSIIRYSVFVFQFYIVCQFFNIDLGFVKVAFSSACLYFAMSMLPMFTIGEPGLRGSLTAIFFEPFTFQIASVISASLLLWFINVLLVAIVGALFLFNQKIFKYESPSGSKC